MKTAIRSRTRSSRLSVLRRSTILSTSCSSRSTRRNYVAGTSYTPHNQYISGGLMARADRARRLPPTSCRISAWSPITPPTTSGASTSPCRTSSARPQSEAAEAPFRRRASPTGLSVNGSVVTDQLPICGRRKSPAIPRSSSTWANANKVDGKDRPFPNFIGYGVADVNWLANTRTDSTFRPRAPTVRDVYVSAAYQDIEPEGTEVDKGTTITVEFTTGGASD